jgi:hypothetical protein
MFGPRLEAMSALDALANLSLLELEAISAINALAKSTERAIYIRPIPIPVDPIKKIQAQKSLELQREKLAVFIKHSMTMEELRQSGSPERLQHLSKRLQALVAKPTPSFEKIPAFPIDKIRRRPKMQSCMHDTTYQAR